MSFRKKIFFVILALNAVPFSYWLTSIPGVGLWGALRGQTLYAIASMGLFGLLIILRVQTSLRSLSIILPFILLMFYGVVFSWLTGAVTPNAMNLYFRITYVVLFILMFRTIDFNAEELFRGFIYSGIAIALITVILTDGFTNQQYFSYELGVRRFRGLGSMLGYGNYFSLLAVLLYVGIREKKFPAVYGYLLFIFFFYNLALTAARSALLGLVLPITLYEWLFNGNQSKIRRMFLLSVILMVAFITVFYGPIASRVTMSTNLHKFTAGRYDSWIYIWNLNTSPLRYIWGLGPGQTETLLRNQHLQMLHNDNLQIYFDFGLVGIFIWIGFFIGLFKKGLKRLKYPYPEISFATKLALISLAAFFVRSNVDTLLHHYTHFVLYLIFPLFVFRLKSRKNGKYQRPVYPVLPRSRRILYPFHIRQTTFRR